MLHKAVKAPSMINSQRHPRIPSAPSIPLAIAPASKPPNAPARIAAEMYTENLLLCSSFLYLKGQN
jgi:hypothetical protein